METSFSEKQSLEVIREMINNSRTNYRYNAVYLLIWGWLILIAALIQYAELVTVWEFNTLYSWGAAVLIAMILHAIAGKKDSNEKQAVTFIDRTLSALWSGSSGFFVILMLIGFTYGWLIIYPLIIAAYGWGVLVTGAIIRFKPLIWGGVTNFFIAGAAVFVRTPEIVLLLVLSLIVSYFIPAYLLKNNRDEKPRPTAA